MDKEDVRERLNQHLKRKLQPNDSIGSSNPKHQSPESANVPQNSTKSTQFYQSQPQPPSTPSAPPSKPTSTTNNNSKKSPRKSTTNPRNSKRQTTLNNEGSSASNSTHTTPSGTPISRSMTATPIGSGCEPQPIDTNPETGSNVAANQTPDKEMTRSQEKYPNDMLTTVLTQKRMSMFHDPEVVDFLNSIMRSLGTK